MENYLDPTILSNDKAYEAIPADELDFRQIHPIEVSIIENDPRIAELAETKGIARRDAETLVARNLAWRIDAAWNKEKHILNSFDYDAQALLDELASEGHRARDGRVLFQREYINDIKAYDADILYARGLKGQKFFQDGRSIFYTNHVVADEVSQKIHGLFHGEAARSAAGGRNAYISDSLNSMEQSALWMIKNPDDVMLGLAREYGPYLIPVIGTAKAASDSIDAYHDTVDAYKDWNTAEEHAALAYLHGNAFESGKLATEHTLTNIELSMQASGALMSSSAAATVGKISNLKNDYKHSASDAEWWPSELAVAGDPHYISPLDIEDQLHREQLLVSLKAKTEAEYEARSAIRQRARIFDPNLQPIEYDNKDYDTFLYDSLERGKMVKSIHDDPIKSKSKIIRFSEGLRELIDKINEGM